MDAQRASIINFEVYIGAFFDVMRRTIMFGLIVGLVVGSWAPVVSELTLGFEAPQSMEYLARCLCPLWLDVVGDNACYVLLSVWMGVGGCLWPISLRSCPMGIASWVLM